MFKQILALSLLLVISNAFIMEAFPIQAFPGNYTRGELANFTEGFNDKLAVDTAEDFAKCVDIPAIPDLQKLYQDLNVSKPNPLALVADVMTLYGDYHNIKSLCPQMAQNYEHFFSNFTNAIQHDTKNALLKLGENIAGNFTDLQVLATQGLQEFGAEHYYDAGADLGEIVQIALRGFI